MTPASSSTKRRRPPRWLLTAIPVAAVLAALVILPSTGLWIGDDDGAGNPEPTARPAAQPRAAAVQPYSLAAVVERSTPLRSKPGGGRVLGTVQTRTEYKTRTVLAVLDRRDGWLRVTAAESRNNRLGWIDADDATLASIRTSATIDLSQRRITVRRNGRVARRFTVAIGRSEAPSPQGRFAVTDRLHMRGGPYGCCALALTAHQPRIPQGWSGGDRIAIHATPNTWTIGKATTAGCFRSTDANLRWLMRTLEPGSPVEVRA